MDEAHALAEWMRQNGYSLTWVTEHIDFAPETLSKALETGCFSHQLVHALYEHFGVRVIAAGTHTVPKDVKDGALPVERRQRRRRIELKSRAIDLERAREQMRRSLDERGQSET